jgi:phi LC3 family holin
MQSRFKSKVVWLAVISQIMAILLALGVIDVSQNEIINTIVASVLQLLVLFGVLNNPTDGSSF